jgi:hypothetical protein
MANLKQQNTLHHFLLPTDWRNWICLATSEFSRFNSNSVRSETAQWPGSPWDAPMISVHNCIRLGYNLALLHFYLL